ncbi:hypothetical protein R6Q59_026403 [Mikania micrantha]
MAGGNFVQRVMSYLVNEILVDSLANSRTFQRFAVKTSKSMEEMSSLAAKKRQEIAEQVKEISRNFEYCVLKLFCRCKTLKDMALLGMFVSIQLNKILLNNAACRIVAIACHIFGMPLFCGTMLKELKFVKGIKNFKRIEFCQ